MNSKRRYIFLAWEFPGLNSKGGTALSKRSGVIYKGFINKGYEVIVITRNHFSASVATYDKNIYVLPGPEANSTNKLAFVRKFFTLLYTLTIGDRSGWWGLKVYCFLKREIKVSSADVVISFFTPRGPVLAGNLIARNTGCKWIVDLQDTFDEGLGDSLSSYGKWWFRRSIKLSNTVVHVSPEWAQRDGESLNKHICVLRHCLPPSTYRFKAKGQTSNPLKILYYGSLDKNNQHHSFFFETLRQQSDFLFYYAGQQSVSDYFAQHIESSRYRYLGWLNETQLFNALDEIDFVVIFSYTLQTRKVVPSKLFELISWNVPCLVIGEDSGGIESLQQEFTFNFPWARNAQELTLALGKTDKIAHTNYSVFNSLSAENLVNQYLKIIENE